MATTTSATRDETLRQIADYAGVLADGYPDMRRDLQRGVDGIDIAWAGFERGRRQMFIRLCDLMPDVAELCREVCKHSWPFPLGRTGPHGLTGRADDVDWDQAIAELRRIDVAATHRAASGATEPNPDEPTQAKPLSLDHYNILTVLHDTGAVMSQYEIVSELKARSRANPRSRWRALSRGTIGTRLKELRQGERKFVERPVGPRSGDRITKAGRSELRRRGSIADSAK